MTGLISIAVNKRCYNLYESYGEICVGCGCCSSNKQKRLEARIALHKRLIENDRTFDQWCDDPDLRALQERNIAENIAFSEKAIAKYEAELMDGGASDAAD